jgi:hypothetical protein
MDVVEAKRADWVRDPFGPVVEDGILYGRGASDMKFSGALALASLIELRREGYKPRRTIIIEFSGDEETTMKTSGIIAERLKDAELVLNIDGGGGCWTKRPASRCCGPGTAPKRLWRFQAGSDQPRRPQFRAARRKRDRPAGDRAGAIGAYHFTPELNPLTKAFFESAAKFDSDPKIAAAMRAFAANPRDEAAIATLRANPATVGMIGTTCVPTMVNGGHALNALPQRATANINCRIFPGHPLPEIMAELAKVAASPVVKFSDVTEGSVAVAGIADAARFRRGGGEGDGEGLSGHGGDPGAIVGRIGLDVVPPCRRAQLWRQPGVREGVGGVFARAQRAHPAQQYPPRRDVLPERADRPEQVGSRVRHQAGRGGTIVSRKRRAIPLASSTAKQPGDRHSSSHRPSTSAVTAMAARRSSLAPRRSRPAGLPAARDSRRIARRAGGRSRAGGDQAPERDPGGQQRRSAMSARSWR